MRLMCAYIYPGEVLSFHHILVNRYKNKTVWFGKEYITVKRKNVNDKIQIFVWHFCSISISICAWAYLTFGVTSLPSNIITKRIRTHLWWFSRCWYLLSLSLSHTHSLYLCLSSMISTDFFLIYWFFCNWFVRNFSSKICSRLLCKCVWLCFSAFTFSPFMWIYVSNERAMRMPWRCIKNGSKCFVQFQLVAKNKRLFSVEFTMLEIDFLFPISHEEIKFKKKKTHPFWSAKCKLKHFFFVFSRFTKHFVLLSHKFNVLLLIQIIERYVWNTDFGCRRCCRCGMLVLLLLSLLSISD